MKQQVFKVGDLVRVPGVDACGTWHGYRAGQVVEVVGINCHYQGQVSMEGLNRVGVLLGQGIDRRHLKLAKQAMKRRDLYASRRG